MFKYVLMRNESSRSFERRRIVLFWVTFDLQNMYSQMRSVFQGINNSLKDSTL